MTRVPVNPALIRWARERAGRAQEELASRFGKLPEWETGTTRPTLKQIEAFARAVHVPVGYLFLPEPPEESVPIPDFRTVAGQSVTRPSPSLLDTIYACQEQQTWYRDFARVTEQPAVEFVGSVTLETAPGAVAERMRDTLGFSLAARHDCSTWSDALRLFIRKAEDAGVLVMINGVVKSNTSRRLDPAEFRGFALSDPLAPLVFVNGADTRAAQMFTLAHELAHIWLGTSALSDSETAPKPGVRREEVWCNAVAAELLVPLTELRARLWEDEELPPALNRLAREFRVSTLVILRRLRDADWLDRNGFEAIWEEESARLRNLARRRSDGGNFYRTTLSRVGRRFARALVISTLEGQTLYRDAYRMLGVSKVNTFEEIGRQVGVLQ